MFGGYGICNFGADSTPRFRPTTEKKNEDFGTANALLAKNAAEKCLYCLNKHEHADCRTIRNIAERKNVLRNNTFDVLFV